MISPQYCVVLNGHLIINLMIDISQVLQKGEELFLTFADEIQRNKISDISIRRALKKYDVKNLKINNVTPLRAKKMYATIIPKYFLCLISDMKVELQPINHGLRIREGCSFGVLCAICTKILWKYTTWQGIKLMKKIEDFEYLRSMFPLKEIQLIKFQIYSLVKKDNKNCGWKIEEDNLLRSLVQKQDIKSVEWSSVSKEFFIQSCEQYFRNAKQCRERWLNHLDPNKMKGKWQPEQDKILLKQVLEKGKKWSKIVEALDGKKNEHMIKNRYKSLIHKKEKACKNKKLKENDLIKLILKDYEDGTNQIEHQNEESEGDGQDIDEEFEDGDDDDMSEKVQIKNEQLEPKQEESQIKHINSLSKSQNWPIIVEPNNKKVALKEENSEKIEEQEKKLQNQIQLCGSKVDKEFVNSLFFNVSTPVPDDNNRIHSIILETRSPAGNLFLSPFPAGCWTPTIFLVDDTQQSSPQSIINGFSNTVKSTFHKFLADDNEKK